MIYISSRSRIALIISTGMLSCSILLFSIIFLFSNSVSVSPWIVKLIEQFFDPLPIYGSGLTTFTTFICLIPAAFIPENPLKSIVVIAKTIFISPLPTLIVYVIYDFDHLSLIYLLNIPLQYVWVIIVHCLAPAIAISILRYALSYHWGGKKHWFIIVVIAICTYAFISARDIRKEHVPSINSNTQKLGLLVKLGDTPDQVNRAYHIPLSPEAPTIGYPSSDFLPQEGICFFFDKTGKIYKIRLESPFQGNVKGIKIGDSSETVLKSLDEPTRSTTLSGQSSPNIFYYTHEGLELRFDSTGVVQTIFLSN